MIHINSLDPEATPKNINQFIIWGLCGSGLLSLIELLFNNQFNFVMFAIAFVSIGFSSFIIKSSLKRYFKK